MAAEAARDVGSVASSDPATTATVPHDRPRAIE
jgi:hypothetical protein